MSWQGMDAAVRDAMPKIAEYRQAREEAAGGYLVPEAFIKVMRDHARSEGPWPRPTYPYKPLTLRQKARIKVMAWRERIGFAIAGYTPSDYDE